MIHIRCESAISSSLVEKQFGVLWLRSPRIVTIYFILKQRARRANASPLSRERYTSVSRCDALGIFCFPFFLIHLGRRDLP
jgi:hypothetical protein